MGTLPTQYGRGGVPHQCPLASVASKLPLPIYANVRHSDDSQSCQARLRGIRVELELDFPAHASSFCVGYPQLCANVPNGRDGHCGLDVSKNFTFEFVDGLVAELGTPSGGGTAEALFFEDFFHFGGDEVDTRCWGPPPGMCDTDHSFTSGFC